MHSLNYFSVDRQVKAGKKWSHLKIKLVPIECLIQRLMFWVCDLVPPDLFDDNYVIPSCSATAFSDDTDDDVIFDTNLSNEIDN